MNQQPDLLVVSSSPHIHTAVTTQKLMLDVVVALLPAVAASVYLFGLRALAHIVISTASCLAFETLFCRLRKWNNTIWDFSAVITGILLAFNLPVSAPLWISVVGAFMAIFVAKMLFGGLGKNFVNPALIGRVFLANSFSSDMVIWTRPILNPLVFTGAPGSVFALPSFFGAQIDAIAGATPLDYLKSGSFPEAYTHPGQLMNMLLGVHPGCLGETCGVLIVLGGLYLMLRGVITWHIPVAYLGTVAFFAWFFPVGEVLPLISLFYSLTGGGLLLGAFFMATDYVTSPVTGTGKLLYGVGCGLLTVIIRRFGPATEGVSFSILIMNLLVWFIDRFTLPRSYGEGVQGK